MKKWNVLSSLPKRMLLQMMLGFFLGRVVLYGCNPIGAAYFAAGFSKEISLRLINALYLTTDDNIRYATADVVVLDLYEGTSQYLKSGAAATWVRHEGKVEEIQGQALPVGIVKDEKPYIQKGKIYSGDYVIMMTDGVLDAFLGEEDVLIGYMEQNHKINPQEWAEDILTLALKQKNGQAMDDMSVIVAGIWEK